MQVVCGEGLGISNVTNDSCRYRCVDVGRRRLRSGSGDLSNHQLMLTQHGEEYWGGARCAGVHAGRILDAPATAFMVMWRVSECVRCVH
jgi:hypothetical protein